MAVINYTDQIKYTGKGYLDAKMMPVNTVEDLKKISLTQRFEGLTITVLNNGTPEEYWLVGGITNNHWIPKKNGNDYKDLRLLLEDGFLKLMDGDKQLGDAVDFNDFFPENTGTTNDLYIENIDYTTTNEKDANGIFMRFTYSDGSEKYLDMSQFLQKTYESGSGIVIEGNVISIDSAISGKITSLEKTIESKADKAEIESINEKINNIESNNSELEEAINKKVDIETVNAINDRLSKTEEFVIINTENIEINRKSIENNASAIEENKTKIETKADKSDVNDINDKINTLESSITANTESILLNTELIEANNSAIKANSEAIETKADKLTVISIQRDVEEIQENITSNETVIEQIQTNIQELENVINNEETGLNKEVNDIKNNITELNEFKTNTSITIEQLSENKVDKVDGSRLMTDEEGAKLNNIEEGAQKNVIESVKVNGEKLVIDETDKSVNIIIPSSAIEGVADNEKVLYLDDNKLKTSLSITYIPANENEKPTLNLQGINGEIISSIDASAFVKDGMLSSVKVDEPKEGETGTKYLVLTFNTDAGKEDIRLDISQLENYYKAGDGISLNDNTFSIKLDETSNKYLQLTTNGISISQSLIDEINALNKTTLEASQKYTDDNFVKLDGFNEFTEEMESKLEGIQEGANVNLIENVKVNGIESTINEDKIAEITIDSRNIELGESIIVDEKEVYEPTTKISTVLQNIQNSLSAAISNKPINLTNGNGIEINTNNDITTIATKISPEEGNIISVSEDGLFAAMYYEGDDVE